MSMGTPNSRPSFFKRPAYLSHKPRVIAFFILTFGIACLVISRAAADADRRTIPFKISSKMWYAPSKKLMPTPQPVIEKIKKVFELWATVKDAHLKFRYAGLVDKSYAGFHQIPRDGSIYVILNNWYMGNCIDGLGEHWGAPPGTFDGGAAVLNTRKGIHTLRWDTLTHEVGHALGIDIHGASPSNIMSEVGHAWNILEYMTLSEQDHAALIARWNPQFKDLYSISGSLRTTLKSSKASVFAVDINSGHAYSAETDSRDKFTIYLLKSGDYRIFAKDAEALAYQKSVSQSPSWYISDGHSTNDPYGGAILHLDQDNRNIKNINIKMIDRKVPFNLFFAGSNYGKADPYCFMRPGAKTSFNIQYKGLVSVEGYGKHPDYAFSNLRLEPKYKLITLIDVAASPDAETGERLIIAKGGSGEMIQAGLVGVNVVKELPVMISLGGINDLEAQIDGKIDFRAIQIGAR
jgi:hypothetical protein